MAIGNGNRRKSTVKAIKVRFDELILKRKAGVFVSGRSVMANIKLPG